MSLMHDQDSASVSESESDLSSLHSEDSQPPEVRRKPEGLTWKRYLHHVSEGSIIPIEDYTRYGAGPAALNAGVRRSLDVAHCQVVAEWCRGSLELTRNRNAWLIVSGIVPDVMTDFERPYCIWHPDVPREDTCAKLVKEHPAMRYQIARVCAVGGYTNLYRRLNVLPDVAVAEEVHESGTAGASIYQSIMAAPMRYSVMNDYLRTICAADPRGSAFLNGDTAVRSLLYWPEHPSTECPHLDITENAYYRRHDDYASKSPCLLDEEVRLLCATLPFDLPTLNEDLFILLAAFEGNIDRYSRLRRPAMIEYGGRCVLHGMLQSTSFSLWILAERNQNRYRDQVFLQYTWIRRIISNDLSWLTPDLLDEELPWMICDPQIPCDATLEELVRRRPSTVQTVARAYISGYHWHGCRDLQFTPTYEIYWEAK